MRKESILSLGETSLLYCNCFFTKKAHRHFKKRLKTSGYVIVKRKVLMTSILSSRATLITGTHRNKKTGIRFVIIVGEVEDIQLSNEMELFRV